MGGEEGAAAKKRMIALQKGAIPVIRRQNEQEILSMLKEMRDLLPVVGHDRKEIAKVIDAHRLASVELAGESEKFESADQVLQEAIGLLEEVLLISMIPASSPVSLLLRY